MAYSRLRLDKKVAKPGDIIHAEFDVTNRGPVDGEEVVQLYFHSNGSLSNRPIRQLGAFRRIPIRRGKTLTVTLDLPVESLKVYSPERKGFGVVPGGITVEVGASSGDLRLSDTLSLEAPAEDGR